MPETSITSEERDNIFDLYWGGKERRITGLTIRIIGVNILALVTLFVVFLYMGQYHASVVEAKVESVGTEAILVSYGLSEVVDNPQKLNRLAARFAIETQREIRVFDLDGRVLFDSVDLGIVPLRHSRVPNNMDVIRKAVKFILTILPRKELLPYYPSNEKKTAYDYPDVGAALKDGISVSVWRNDQNHLYLSTAAALEFADRGEVAGIVLLTHTAYDIEDEVSDVWRNIAYVFVVTFIIMIVLSIYLSGVIAAPIKRLAFAAEGVRKGALGHDDIPDYSNHHDEIGELSLALRQMTKALYDRMHTIEGFAADVAHELKNPLTSLRSAIETLERVKKKSDKEKLMGIIHHDLERINRLITDISRSSRIDAELSRAKLSKVDLREVLTHILDVYRTPLEREQNALSAQVDGVNIALDIHDGEDVYVLGQADPLYQVFENILSNALSFSKPKDQITIDVSREAKNVFVTIVDQGGGIKADNPEDIFQRFYSRRPDAEKYGEHSGLGLAICKQIIEIFDGKIMVENIEDDEGKPIGACFTVVLKSVA